MIICYLGPFRYLPRNKKIFSSERQTLIKNSFNFYVYTLFLCTHNQTHWVYLAGFKHFLSSEICTYIPKKFSIIINLVTNEL